MKQLLTLSENGKTSVWQLIARRLADEATESEMIQLRDRLDEEAELSLAVQALFTVWEKPSVAIASDRTTAMLVHRIKQRCISLDN